MKYTGSQTKPELMCNQDQSFCWKTGNDTTSVGTTIDFRVQGLEMLIKNILRDVTHASIWICVALFQLLPIVDASIMAAV